MAASRLAEPEPTDGQWLARQCARRPRLVASVESVIGDPYGTREVLCGWQDWYAGLQLFEHAARRGTRAFTGADYRHAAALLDPARSSAGGPPGAPGLSPGRARQLARLLRGLGSYAEDQHAYRLSWQQRYASRALTAAEVAAARQVRDGRVRAAGRSLPGIDGGRYALAIQGDPGKPGSRPVVVVTNSAGGAELVPFADEGAARGWLAGRLRGATGPVPVSGPGTACRASREEQLLGWLVHAAYGDVPWDQLAAVRWTTHLRAELFLALSPDGRQRPALYPGESPARNIRRQLASRLAFAPGWAVAAIGWPGARRALAYADRLAAAGTVTGSHAMRVAAGLARADAEATARQAAAGDATSPAVRETATLARRSLPGTRQRTAGSDPPLTARAAARPARQRARAGGAVIAGRPSGPGASPSPSPRM
jgi:hypothetical protein